MRTKTPPRAHSHAAAVPDDSLNGYLLTGLVEGESGGEDDPSSSWKDLEFAEILAAIRKATPPLVLRFEAPDETDDDADESAKEKEELFEDEKKVEETDHPDTASGPCMSQSPAVLAGRGDEEKQNVSSSTEEPSGEVSKQQAEQETSRPSIVSSPNSSFNLSSWTSRVSAAAAATATSAAAMARAANERAKQAAAERAAAAAAAEEQEASNNNSNNHDNYQIFVQSQTGAFLPITTSSAAETRPTNSSLLVVRISASKPVSSLGHQFQWFRSSSSSSNDGWEELTGATAAAFQPSATEVGYRLRCVVMTNKKQDDEDESSSSDDSSDDDGDDENNETTVICECETSLTVTAAPPLFNGARQALVRGAQFGSLHGRGKAEGRVFRVTIEVGKNAKLRHQVCCAAVTIYQVSGGAAEPIHPEPLLGVTACSDYGHGKNLELIFPFLESESMVSALCTDNNRFQLQAPNRMARESILLALGIANYRGKPVDLDASMILYNHHHREEEDNGLRSDDSLESSSSGGTSNSGRQQQHNQQQLALERPPLPQRRISNNAEPSAFLHRRHLSTDSSVDQSLDGSTVASQELELELERLRAKLARKDKVVSELQRQITTSDEALLKTEHLLRSKESELQQSQADHQTTRLALADAEKQIQASETYRRNEVANLQTRNETLQSEMQVQNNMIAALEKSKRTLQNEKDVLTAAVEARDSKLVRMSDLQASFDEASVKLAQEKEFQKELDESNKRLVDARAEVERIRQSKTECQQELAKAQSQIQALEKQLQLEKAKTASHQSELEKEQMKIQKLKAERNSYKQKGDSLAKEMNRICRHGRTVREVEKVLADDVTRREEVALLREQKHKALEQVEYFRTAYEQSLSVQKMAGLDHDSGKLLERNAELERLLSELTEYLNAKEMQLQTMKQVNDAMQLEIRDLAKASMSKNEI